MLKINNVLIDNAEDLKNVAMPMHNLTECSKKSRNTTGCLWNYYRDEPNNHVAYSYNADFMIGSASFF